MTPEQLEQIKERATDLLLEINPDHDRVAVRATVDLYVRILNKATNEVIAPKSVPVDPVEHDFNVGIPGWKRVYPGSMQRAPRRCEDPCCEYEDTDDKCTEACDVCHQHGPYCGCV